MNFPTSSLFLLSSITPCVVFSDQPFFMVYSIKKERKNEKIRKYTENCKPKGEMVKNILKFRKSNPNVSDCFDLWYP